MELLELVKVVEEVELVEVVMVMAWLLSRGAQVSPVYWYLRRST